jgi:DNA-binding transcriptional LysR family regulator
VITSPSSAGRFKLRQLERDFGLKLFERDGRTLVLTDAGSELLKQARQIVSSCNAVSEQMSELRDHVADTLHLVHTGELGTAFSAQLLLAFRQRFPAHQGGFGDLRAQLAVHAGSRGRKPGAVLT